MTATWVERLQLKAQYEADCTEGISKGDCDYTWINTLCDSLIFHLIAATVQIVSDSERIVVISNTGSLIDEKAARGIAQEMGLALTGFPGVLGRAGLDGLLTQADIR